MSRGVIIALCVAFLVAAGLFAYLTAEDPSDYLVFSTWGTATEVESFQRLVEHYNATRHPKHAVKLSHGEQNQYTERLLVQAAARGLPDVIHIDRKDVPLMVHRGLFEDLTPIMRQDTGFTLGAFLPELLPGARVGERYYGVPHNFSTLVLYYNRDHFDAERIPYPDSTWTWETMLDAARRLTKKDASGKINRYGCLVHIVVPTLIYQNGGKVLNEEMDSCVIASPESEGAVRFVTDLSEKYGVTWNMLAQNLQWDDMFAGGRLSMLCNGRWSAAWYMRSMQPGVADVAPLPRGKFRKGAAVNHLMAISSQSAKKEEAWEFVKFLVSEEGMRMVNENGANIPSLHSIAYSDEFLRHRTTPTMNNRVFLDELRYSVTWPFDQGPYVSLYTLQSEMDEAMRRILLGQATPTQTLKIMEDNVNRVIATARRVPQPERFAGSIMFYLCLGLLVLPGLAILTLRRRRRLHGR
jgi:multiple sugar transport system substrate-binding protein